VSKVTRKSQEAFFKEPEKPGPNLIKLLGAYLGA